MYRSGAGVRIYRKESRFAGESEVIAEELGVVACREAVRSDRESRKSARITHIRSSLPNDGGFAYLRSSVLGLESWHDLDSWFEKETGKLASSTSPVEQRLGTTRGSLTVEPRGSHGTFSR